MLWHRLKSPELQTKISGTVVTQDEGEPIVGASVVPQKQKAGVVTDVDGKFTINVPAGTKLVISYVGMETQTVAARNGMTVRLQSNTSSFGFRLQAV